MSLMPAVLSRLISSKTGILPIAAKPLGVRWQPLISSFFRFVQPVKTARPSSEIFVPLRDSDSKPGTRVRCCIPSSLTNVELRFSVFSAGSLLKLAKPAPLIWLPAASISVTVSNPSVNEASSANLASDTSWGFKDRKVAKTTAATGLGGGGGVTVG